MKENGIGAGHNLLLNSTSQRKTSWALLVIGLISFVIVAQILIFQFHNLRCVIPPKESITVRLNASLANDIPSQKKKNADAGVESTIRSKTQPPSVIPSCREVTNEANAFVTVLNEEHAFLEPRTCSDDMTLYNPLKPWRQIQSECCPPLPKSPSPSSEEEDDIDIITFTRDPVVLKHITQKFPMSTKLRYNKHKFIFVVMSTGHPSMWMLFENLMGQVCRKRSLRHLCCNAVLIPLDSLAEDLCTSTQVSCHYIDGEAFKENIGFGTIENKRKHNSNDNRTVWGDEAYSFQFHIRPHINMKLLDEGLSSLISDGDVAVLNDPISAMNVSDMSYACDHSDQDWMINAGFTFTRVNEFSHTIISNWISKIDDYIRSGHKSAYRNQPQIQAVLESIMSLDTNWHDHFHCIPLLNGVMGRFAWLKLAKAFEEIKSYRLFNPVLTNSNHNNMNDNGNRDWNVTEIPGCVRSIHMNGLGDIGTKIAFMRKYKLWTVSFSDISHMYYNNRESQPRNKNTTLNAIMCCEDIKDVEQKEIRNDGVLIPYNDIVCAWCSNSPPPLPDTF